MATDNSGAAGESADAAGPGAVQHRQHRTGGVRQRQLDPGAYHFAAGFHHQCGLELYRLAVEPAGQQRPLLRHHHFQHQRYGRPHGRYHRLHPVRQQQHQLSDHSGCAVRLRAQLDHRPPGLAGQRHRGQDRAHLHGDHHRQQRSGRGLHREPEHLLELELLRRDRCAGDLSGTGHSAAAPRPLR